MAPAPPPQDSLSAGGIPAGYGRSCTNCSRAKCRCILRPAGGKCDRCHRLGKDCQPMATSRKRVARRIAATRTTQLEEKLDDLVSISRANRPQQQPSQSATKSSPDRPTNYDPSCHPWLSRLDSLANVATTSQIVLGYNITPSVSDSDRLPEPQPGEAEAYLDKFRQWLEFFPFMNLSADLTAEALRKERPFLWLCIMNITTMSLPQQRIMRDRVRREVAQRVVINQERSMDIFLGLIAYITWGHINAGPKSRPFLALYIPIAICIIYELGLTRSPNEDPCPTACYKSWGQRLLPPPKDRTMEERRAILSFWFVTSVCTSYLGKMETFVWTPHMQDSLELLEREKECPSDEVLVTLIKLRLICEETHKLLARDMMERDLTGQAPTYVFKKALLARLQVIREGLSPSLASKHLIKTHLPGTEALVHAIGLFGRKRASDPPRVDGIYGSLMATTAWYDAFFSLPLTDVPGLPFSAYVELSQIQALLYRLTVMEDPAWDEDIVRNTADVLSYVDRTIEMMVKVEALYPLRSESNDIGILEITVRVLRAARASWAAAIYQHSGGIPTPNSQAVRSAAPHSALVGHPTMMNQGAPADFNDWSWMSDFFSPWES